ncbi:Tm-1-like ATP-binding domain-containing protein [Salinibacterium sp. G-O1]|uniref:Tm-1-like ATP-binding domain-containing protein n=1 Tax=Salinibacterium sp. G-O1 TaxID=3046208 RepID=UPI0024BB79E9|nr:Tm-1-like ATP-binding domain-containing protein [Salinibacterium sp. G-O1]MDJ0336229.1 Tm-1-like ATP-binding domain-containing protein [Salinibacterium sp. G-O1]
MGKVVIVATLDTKGPEVAYLRDRLNILGLETLVVDSGILGEPVGIVPDVSHSELAGRGGITLAQLQGSGTRGRAVETMRELVRDLVRERFAAGEIIGGISVGGVGSVMGAAAIQELPVGVPKIVVAPTASGHHEFGPYVGTKDVMVVHSVVDILGLNPVSTTVFDNVAAAMFGMLAHGHPLTRPAQGQKFVATTMLGNTTAAVGALKDRLAENGIETVVFHSNGVGGRAMEELAGEGQFVGVIDYTTNEINDPLVGGIHNGGPDRLATVGRLGLPQVLVPGCMDFSVWAAGSIPASMRARPVYDHNPEYTLVRATHDEKAQLGRIFAERVNETTAPAAVIMPMLGLSIPATPDGPFWDPEGDALFLAALRENLRPDIPIETVDLHINDPDLGRLAADRFLSLINKEKP